MLGINLWRYGITDLLDLVILKLFYVLHDKALNLPILLNHVQPREDPD
jgi:hypothetical protein